MAKKEQAKIEQNLIDFIYESFVKLKLGIKSE